MNKYSLLAVIWGGVALAACVNGSGIILAVFALIATMVVCS